MKAVVLNFKHLYCLLSVAEHQSVSRAAGIVHLSQPAVTQAVTKIEKLIDQRLFDRSGKGLHPNEAGEIFIRRTKRAISLLTEGFSQASREQRLNPTRLLRSFNTTQLRALIQLAESGSYALAGRQLGISHSSVHRSIRELQAWSGIEITQPGRNGIRLTARATRLANQTKLAFGELRQGIEEIRMLGSDSQVSLMLGSLPLARHRLIAKCLTEFLGQYPNANVRLDEGPYEDLFNRLLRGDLDILVGALRGNLSEAKVKETPLFESEVAWVVGSQHPLAKSSGLKLSEIRNECFWINRPGTPMRNIFERQFTESALPLPERIIQSSSHEVMLDLLKNTRMIAMVSYHMVTAEIRKGDLHLLPFEIAGAYRQIGYTVRDNFVPTAAQQYFLTLLTEQAHRFNSGA